MTLRIGLIGAGIHGARYLRHALRDVDGLVPVALCRRDAAAGRALAAEFGCRYVAEPADLIAAHDVDGVLVVTPPATHFADARAVRRAGKALLLEKPLTGTLAEARALDALDAALPGPPLFLAQTLRWNPVIRRVRELVPRLGTLRLVRSAQRLAPTGLAWQRDPAQTVGGSVLLTGVHGFDTIRWVTGREFAEVDSRQERYRNPAVEDFFLARCRLDDGTYASVEVSKYGPARAGLLELVGERGQLLADYLEGGIRLTTAAGTEHLAVDASAPTLVEVL
jgi:predicted dehydrogenase